MCRLQTYSISIPLRFQDKVKHTVERVGDNNQAHVPDPGQIYCSAGLIELIKRWLILQPHTTLWYSHASRGIFITSMEQPRKCFQFHHFPWLTIADEHRIWVTEADSRRWGGDFCPQPLCCANGGRDVYAEWFQHSSKPQSCLRLWIKHEVYTRRTSQRNL